MADDALEYLLNLPQFANVADDAYAPGLDRMRTLLAAMGNPHNELRAVHVAGTNGKGSVASMMAAIAGASGVRTGLHTSPHLTHVTQRMRINGEAAPTDWLADAVDEHRSLFDRLEPSFFEITVALTFQYFAEQNVDLAVIEVGLGGRLDSTNVLNPVLSVITHVDFDHTDILGETLAEIAREKAGIIKLRTPALSGVTQNEARAAIAAVALQKEAPLHNLRDEVAWSETETGLNRSVMDVNTPVRRYDDLEVSLVGAHQQANAALALRAAELAIPSVAEGPEGVYEGLRDVQGHTGFRGRVEVVQECPLVVIDVAHNPPGVRAALDVVAPVVAERGGTLHVCLNAVEGKGLPEIADMLAEYHAEVTPFPMDTKRALAPHDIAETLRAHGVTTHPPQALSDTVDAFLRTAAPEDGLLCTGTHKVMEVFPEKWG